MSRALGPRPPLAAGNAALAWMLLAAAWGLAGLAWLAWAAARIAAALAGGRVPPFGVRWLSALVHGRTAQAWPGTPTPLVGAAGAVLAAVLAAAAVTAWRIIAGASPARRPGRRAQRGPVHPPARPGPGGRDRPSGCGPRWPALRPGSLPPPRPACCWAA